MNKISFWDSFVPAEAKEARFGIMPEGANRVFINSIRKMMASEKILHLDDDAKIVGVVKKEDKLGDYPAFDQELLCIIFRDEQGRVLTDYRHTVGWLKADSKDADGKIKANAEFVQKHGLKAKGNRFVNAAGLGVQSGDGNNSCKDFMSRLFTSAGVLTPNPELLIGKELVIDIEKEKINGKDTWNVRGYYPANTTKLDNVARAEKIAETAQAEEPATIDEGDVIY
jgi:hypothetical protein